MRAFGPRAKLSVGPVQIPNGRKSVLDDESKEWLDYIGKRNDRALQRQRASGVTTWAIAGVLAWLFFNEVLTKVGALTTDAAARSVHILATAVVLNLFCWGFFLLLLYLLIWGPQYNEVRFESKLFKLHQPIILTLKLILFLLIACLDLYTATLAPHYGLSVWPFLLYFLIIEVLVG